MPEYSIQAPDGNTYSITGPPGASKADIVSRISAKYPQATKPKDASVLGTLGRGAADVAGGLLNPKELGREAYHAVTDWAGHTLKAVDDLSDYLSDKTGFYELKFGPGGVRSVGQAEFKREEHVDDAIRNALLSEKYVREPQTTTGSVVKDLGEFTLGMATAGKVFGIANKTLQGGVSAWTVFDPQQKRLSDVIAKYPMLKGPITNWLKSDPGDTAMEGRLKNAVEGMVFGKAADGFIKALGVLRNAMRGQVAKNAFDLSEQNQGKSLVAVNTVKQGQALAKAEIVGQAAAGQAPDISEGIAKTAEAVEKDIKGIVPRTPTAKTEQAFTHTGPEAPEIPAPQARGQLQEYYRWMLEQVAPGSVSHVAKQAEADIASAYAKQMQHISEIFQRSPERKEYWATNPGEAKDFIKQFEQGKPFMSPLTAKADNFYRSWGKEIEAKEKAAGINYKVEENYIPHLFGDQRGAQEWLRTQGVKVPGFAKQRGFQQYAQAIKAGFKPKFDNPEDIFQARQHASDMAIAKIHALENLSESGLAFEGDEGKSLYRTSYSVPNGKTYWVHDDAKLLINRMFDEKSLWSDRTPVGSVYRGMTALKNNLIPIRLAFSAFHPLHVLTMHMLAASATRSFKAGEWMSSHYSEGSRVLSMLRGQIPGKSLTAMDKQNLQYISEGGLILEQDPRYRTQAIEKLRTEFVNANPGAMLHIHTGALQTIQDTIFKTWIPSLKGASYLADVRAALKAQPSLIDDAAARRVALRRIAKSVENRYGEMNYSTLFWQRTLRDVSVLSATSMGWQLGLFREYGGGAGQLARGLGKIAMNPGNAKEIYNTLKKNGDLDKLFYIANYSTIAAVLGGLITWGMTSKRPQEWMDYFAPRTGEHNPDGTPARVRTMFYPYEFVAMGKRVQQQGPARAAEEWLAAKGTGIPSMLAETWTGIDGLGREIRDPNGTPAERVRQTLNAILRENMPISLQDKGGNESTQQRVLDVAGLSRAPKYLQQTSGESQIEQLWEKHYKAAETPFQQSVRSSQRKALQAAIAAKDDTAVDRILPDMVEKYGLRAQDAKRLVRDASLGTTSYQALFKEMKEEDQKSALKSMDKEERAKYLPYAKRKIQAEFSE